MEGTFGQFISSPLFTFSVGPNKKDVIVHSGPLANLSPALHTLMNGEMIEAKVRRVEWPDVDEDTFVRLTEYAYLRDYTPPLCSYRPSNIVYNAIEKVEDSWDSLGSQRNDKSNGLHGIPNGQNGSYPHYQDASLEGPSQAGNKQDGGEGDGQSLVEQPPDDNEPLEQLPDTNPAQADDYSIPADDHLPQPDDYQGGNQDGNDDLNDSVNNGGYQGHCMVGNQQQGGGQNAGLPDPAKEPALGGHELPYRERGIWSRHLRGKFSTVNFSLAAHEMASKKTFAPRGNTQLNEDFTPVFLGHARLYVLADKYGIESLTQLVLEKLKQTLNDFKLSAANVTDIIELVRFTYAHTPRLVTGKNELRTLVMMFIISSIGQIGETESFQELLGDGGDFVVDFWQIVWA
ncbi:hypothetical protein BDV33DRAFT_163377 [Aspergillus novoparasiticus]|uniref:BTB domain-containing protein n=1 Tax=Aspergillus novoparasiticus TaxID=986946 RepID=A0A5N6F7F4_9EURO|nr:hypothetical protein BDV33DRAFT_163377 [Aspergillus novoparasiticus]